MASVSGGAEAQSEATGAQPWMGCKVASLPVEEVERLREVEQQLKRDTGKEVVVVAYEREEAMAH